MHIEEPVKALGPPGQTSSCDISCSICSFTAAERQSYCSAELAGDFPARFQLPIGTPPHGRFAPFWASDPNLTTDSSSRFRASECTIALRHGLAPVSTIREEVVMRTIAIMNQKGGVGKTTSSVNLAAALARQGKKVCVIDMDPQGHASFHLGLECQPGAITVYDVFSDNATMDDARQLVGDNISIVPSNIDLAAVEVELAGTPGREFILRDAMKHWVEQARFDYVIMDCPPSLGVLTINALCAVTEVIIPLQPHFFALQGLSKLFETTALVTRRLNRDLRVTGVALCLYESGTRLAADVTEDLRHFLTSSDSDTPWATAKIFRSKIRRNIKLAEAPSFGQSIFDYSPKCPGARDYADLGKEVLAMVGDVPVETATETEDNPTAVQDVADHDDLSAAA